MSGCGECGGTAEAGGVGPSAAGSSAAFPPACSRGSLRLLPDHPLLGGPSFPSGPREDLDLVTEPGRAAPGAGRSLSSLNAGCLPGLPFSTGGEDPALPDSGHFCPVSLACTRPGDSPTSRFCPRSSPRKPPPRCDLTGGQGDRGRLHGGAGCPVFNPLCPTIHCQAPAALMSSHNYLPVIQPTGSFSPSFPPGALCENAGPVAWSAFLTFTSLA